MGVQNWFEKFILVLAVAVGLWDTAGSLKPAADAKPLPELATILPETTLVHVRASLDPLFSAEGKGLALAKILAEPEVKAFMAPLSRMIGQKRAEALTQIEKNLGLKLEDLAVLMRFRA